MKYSYLVSVIIFSVVTSSLHAQDVWSLERCIREALDKSLNIKTVELSEKLALANSSQSKQERYPSLNASAGTGLNFGRVINPATNNFETENALFSDVGLSSGIMLYQGGLINNSIRQAELDVEAAREDIQQTKNNIALQVALSYLSVLFADENLQNAQARRDLSQAQLDQIEKRITAGTLPESDRYDVLAQIALDEQDIVRYENDRETNLLGLKQLMLMEPDYPLQIEKPEVTLDGMEAFETYSLASVYEAAMKSQPQIRAQESRIKSAQAGEAIAKASMMPRLTLGGSIGTNFSDLDKRALGYTTVLVPTPGVYINNELTPFAIEQDRATALETTPILTQFDNNLGYGFSLNLSIPIYNNRAARTGVERARIATMQQEVADQQIRQTLKSDIQNALAAARAAKEALDASERAFEAAEIAYNNADRRFALGSINNYDFISARNRLDAARTNRTIAKYDYLFRAKVIEYYLGRGLRLN